MTHENVYLNLSTFQVETVFFRCLLLLLPLCKKDISSGDTDFKWLKSKHVYIIS